MSSTYSSEQPHEKRSATDALASRYRHLFVLPTAPALLVLGAAASLLLSILSKGVSGLLLALTAFAIFLLSTAAVSSAVRIADKRTIANFRRILAVVLAGDVLWLVCVVAGAVFAIVTGSQTALTNAVLFGALACAGFEFLIINGAFVESDPLSFVLALLHPIPTLIIIRLPELLTRLDLVAATSGLLAFAIVGGFTQFLRRRKTKSGHDALSLFRAFMKTWVAGDAAQLEGIISDHAEEADVTTKVMRFRYDKGDVFIVLPGVHPGPFHPVGSYDLPGVVSRAFADLGPVMTLHRPGGHERNLVSSQETNGFAKGLHDFAKTIQPSQAGTVRGPKLEQIGKASAGAIAFGADALLTISFSPYGSDDLDTKVDSELTSLAAESGLDASIVDAHNSIKDTQESPDLSDPGWRRLLEGTSRAIPKELRVAYAHSKEIGFRGRDDLTENGIGVLMVETDKKHVLVLADANNAVPGLREAAARALSESGFSLIDFCTSDSHNLAARGLTVARGYEALGEETPVESIAGAVVGLAKLAEGRLSRASYASGKATGRMKVFGSQSLEEFAGITQSSSSFGSAYLKAASASVGALLVLALFF